MAHFTCHIHKNIFNKKILFGEPYIFPPYPLQRSSIAKAFFSPHTTPSANIDQ